MVRSFLRGRASRKNPKKWRYLSGKTGRFCQKSSVDAFAGWSRKPSPPTQLDDILCQGDPVAARTCSIALLTLDGELGAIFKRWYPDMDIEAEEIPAAA